jgi:hypothetical protein
MRGANVVSEPARPRSFAGALALRIARARARKAALPIEGSGSLWSRSLRSHR